MFTRDVAPGIHRVEDAFTNWYLVEDGDALTIVDCDVPRSWLSLQAALRELGRGHDAVKAVVLTHAHFDHLGFAERARTKLGVPVYCHENARVVLCGPGEPWRDGAAACVERARAAGPS